MLVGNGSYLKEAHHITPCDSTFLSVRSPGRDHDGVHQATGGTQTPGQEKGRQLLLVAGRDHRSLFP